MSLEDEIKNNKSKVFRRAFIKRRLVSTGLFETDWQEITKDVGKWGTVTQKIDSEKQGRIRFSSTNLTMINDDGLYNPAENEASLWFGYASQQRTLFKIEAGFIHQTQGADGIWTNTEFPSSNSEVYTGVLQGDINVNTRNEMNFSIKPLTQILRDYPAKDLSGFTSTGVTASEFMGMIRDHTDGSSNLIFRPFFKDTTTGFNIQTTTVTYANLDSAGSSDIIDKSVWQVVEKLAESENYLAYVSADGTFNFIDRDNIASATTYNFNGVGSSDRTYGIQIKDISFFGFRQSKYYSRVSLKHGSTDTTTSFETVEAEFKVAGENAPWNFGHKTFSMENTWLSATGAALIAQDIFDNVSSKKNELNFNSSFVPHITITDRLSISYDSNPVNALSLWDQNVWVGLSAAVSQSIEQTTEAGNTGLLTSTYQAQSFLAPSGGMTINEVIFKMYALTATTGNLTAQVWDTSLTGGIYKPKSLLATSDNFDVSTLVGDSSGSSIEETITFGTAYTLTASTNYAIVLNSSGLSGDFVYVRKVQTNPYADGRLWSSIDLTPSGWNSNSLNDLYFKFIETELRETDGLIWDDNSGNAIYLLNDEYKPLSIKVNLDKLETTIFSREI